jgi:outer membrane lipoprotein-sorting protein
MVAVGPAVAGASGQTPDPVAIMEEAGERYRGIRAFCGIFRQRLEVPLLDQVTDTEGTLCQEQPNLFAMRFTSPQGDLLVADGEFFWVYYPNTDPGQVLQFSMEVQPGGLDFHREFLEDAPEKYELTYEAREVLDGRPTHVISAKPRRPAGFTLARIWLDVERSLILKVRIGSENGSVRTVALSDIQLNPPADAERFRFIPPPGVQIIRRR